MSLTGCLLNHNRYELCVDGRTAICITPIIAIDSYLNRDPPNLQSPYHSLRGIFHAFEWQRYCSVLGMLANQTTMGGPVWNDHVTFQTKGQSSVYIFVIFFVCYSFVYMIRRASIWIWINIVFIACFVFQHIQEPIQV
jgi:hypothetical protein